MSTLVESSSSEREKQQKQQQESQQAIVRSRLVAKLLTPTPDIREFLYNLVYTQAVVVVGTEAAAFLVEQGQEEGQIGLANAAHIRPDQSAPDVKQKALEAFGQLIGQCYRTGQDAAIIVQDDDLTMEPQYCLVTLLRHETNIVAATAVITRCRDAQRAQQRLEMMQLVAGYFDLWMLRRGTETMRVMAQNHQDVLQYASAISTSDGFQNAVNNVCNELATRTGATRVSIGWAKQRSDGEVDVKLAGLSHTEQFDKKQELSVQLVKVMEECLDQQEIVQYDPDKEGATTQNVTREAQALSRMEGGNRVVTLPMRQKGELIGALTLEFNPEKKPTDAETTGLAVAAEMLGPILNDRHANDRWLITKTGLAARDTWKMAVGPKYWLAKLCVIGGLIGLWALTGGYIPFYGSVVMPMYHVKAPFHFLPVEKRVVSTPFNDARIDEVLKLPGDNVTAGEVLVRFNTAELEQKRIDAQARARRAEIDFNRYSSTKDSQGRDQTADAKAAKAQQESAEAEVKILTGQIERATVKAPISGRIISSTDLREKIQATLRMGEPLFEIAAPDALRVQLDVPDREIQRIHDASSPEGPSHGQIRTSARPDLAHDIHIERIVPNDQPKEGENTFMVFATLDPNVDPKVARSWSPGQGGEAAIDDQPRSLLYQWTHRLVDWARLKVWVF